MKKITLTTLTFLTTCMVWAQWNYRVEISPKTIENLPALHSYVFAQQGNEFLVIGGRIDGIHPRQPFASFSEANKNTQAYVIDIQNNQVWKSDLNSLSNNLKEQLSSTNMNFHQEKDTLYIIGGYGYSPQAADHKTYNFLTTLSVSNVIAAIKNGNNLSAHIKQTSYDKFAVTGGHLAHMNGEFYLVGGHRFDGRYNPMGNNTYTQEYTHEVRRFRINNSGSTPIIYGYSAIHNEDHLRRRDYNLVPQIFEDGSHGFLISSGVFQKNADLPFLYPVQVHDTFIKPITNFNQYLSHYHSASVALYNKGSKQMHSLFLGGLSQYDYENETLIKDDRVPFVKTISLLTQDATGGYKEFKLDEQMPEFLGSSAEFLFNPDLPQISHEIIDLDALSGDTILLGYILGGIQSDSPNPFSDNTISLTKANPKLYAVTLIKSILSTGYLNPIPDLKIFPNPNQDGKLQIRFPFETESPSIFVFNQLGQELQRGELKKSETGGYELQLDDKIPSQMLYLNIQTADKQTYKKTLVWQP